MDKKKARKFHEELQQLQEKYGFQLSSECSEEIDYDYEENPYVSGTQSYLVLTDQNGFSISTEDLMSGYSTCYYCGRDLPEDDNFCNVGCESKYFANKEKQQRNL